MMEERAVDYGFMTIFVGFLITFLDFRINGLNIFPDFVGYIIIAIGLSKAFQLDEKFKTAQMFSVIMIVLSFPDIVEFTGYDPLWPLSLIATIVALLLTWFLLNGVTDVALRNSNEDLANLSEKVLFATIAITIFNLAIILLTNIAGFYSIVFAVVALAMVFVSLLVTVFKLLVIYRASNEFDSVITLEDPYGLQL